MEPEPELVGKACKVEPQLALEPPFCQWYRWGYSVEAWAEGGAVAVAVAVAVARALWPAPGLGPELEREVLQQRFREPQHSSQPAAPRWQQLSQPQPQPPVGRTTRVGVNHRTWPRYSGGSKGSG